MSLTLAHALFENKGVFNIDKTILTYLNWCNSGSMMMGKNTRLLMMVFVQFVFFLFVYYFYVFIIGSQNTFRLQKPHANKGSRQGKRFVETIRVKWRTDAMFSTRVDRRSSGTRVSSYCRLFDYQSQSKLHCSQYLLCQSIAQSCFWSVFFYLFIIICKI